MLANDFTFSTQMVHGASGWPMYMFRNYSPRLGRWTQRDPIGFVNGLNLYAFCGNNPVNAIDLLGLRFPKDMMPGPWDVGPWGNDPTPIRPVKLNFYPVRRDLAWLGEGLAATGNLATNSVGWVISCVFAAPKLRDAADGFPAAAIFAAQPTNSIFAIAAAWCLQKLPYGLGPIIGTALALLALTDPNMWVSMWDCHQELAGEVEDSSDEGISDAWDRFTEAWTWGN